MSKIYIWYGIEVTIDRTYYKKQTGDIELCDISPVKGMIPEQLSHFNIVKSFLKPVS